jgi:uncharacterized protein (DUF305 family)
MKNQSILYGVIGLLAGSLLTMIVATTSVNRNYTGMMRVMGMHSNQTASDTNGHMTSGMGMSMDDMTSSLQGKTGDGFDKTFIAEMIDHHQGAIDMAKLAQQNAKHDEIKALAGNIITAQTSEINQMKAWQSQWGYEASTSQTNDTMNMMGH